ncbi:hypothetical protein AABB24_017172 [Solanum stoloniferum]
MAKVRRDKSQQPAKAIGNDSKQQQPLARTPTATGEDGQPGEATGEHQLQPATPVGSLFSFSPSLLLSFSPASNEENNQQQPSLLHATSHPHLHQKRQPLWHILVLFKMDLNRSVSG